MSAAPLAKVVVLVVEDDRQLRDLFSSALRNEGYAVVAVGDGIDALSYLETQTPAAVVLDLGLSRVSGEDVLSEMAAQRLTERVPVIVVTGSDALELDARHFACILHKPTSPEELIAAVRGCISKARAHKD